MRFCIEVEGLSEGLKGALLQQLAAAVTHYALKGVVSVRIWEEEKEGEGEGYSLWKQG